MYTANLYPRYIFQTVTRPHFTYVIRYDADRIMSTWKNLCSERLGSKVTSSVMGARGFNGISLSLSRARDALLAYREQRYAVISQLFDTRYAG